MDKISDKLAGDIACLGGSMVEHQPRLLGSWVRFPAGAFAIFSISPKASLLISLSLSPSHLLSLTPFPSSSFLFLSPFDLSYALKNAFFAYIPLIKNLKVDQNRPFLVIRLNRPIAYYTSGRT